jgi:hypothetical protein
MWKKVLSLLGAIALTGIAFEGGKAVGRFEESLRFRLREERLRLKEAHLRKLEKELGYLAENLEEKEEQLLEKEIGLPKHKESPASAASEQESCITIDRKFFPYATIFEAIAADDGEVAFEMAGDPNLMVDAALNETSLHWAAQAGKLSAVKSFVEHGAHIASQDINLVTPLHKAVQGGHLSVVAYLLEKGAPVNAKASNGLTPLHSAVHKANSEVIELLLATGADVESKDMFGRSPLSLAEESGNEEIIRILYGEK